MSDHAISNANGWMETISQYCRAMDEETWERLDELQCMRDDDEPLTPDDLAELKELEGLLGDYSDADDARDKAMELPLEVCVRSDWASPCETLTPSEYMILLSTGGPALRIVGDLDRWGTPKNARLQWQDWGTPWTEAVDVAHDDLLTFASIFYLGE